MLRSQIKSRPSWEIPPDVQFHALNPHWSTDGGTPSVSLAG